jgi:VCBS repeat-containing protein
MGGFGASGRVIITHYVPPNTAPTFVSAGAASLSVAQAASATDITGLLHVSDSDFGQTLTWSQSVAPSHGSLSFVSATASTGTGSTDITPGGSISYTPTPGYAGADSFTVQVSDGTAVATRTINVTVAGGPHVSLNKIALDFGLQNIGSTSTPQQITLNNNGTVTLNVTSIAASGDFAVSDNCGSGLGVGGNCTLVVTFIPSASGARSGIVTITTDALGSPHTVALSGTGQGAVAQLSPGSLTFGNLSQGNSSTTQTVTLSNPGGAVLTITSITASGEFVVKSTTCGTTLAKNASCSISVVFTPVSLGPINGSLVIASNADAGTSSISLSGTGTPGPMVSLNPMSWNFSEQLVNTSSAVKSVQLTNTGTADLTTLSLAASGDFSQSNTCGTGLGAGGFCTINVRFTPVQAGSRLGAITLTSNAPGSPHILALSGTGLTPIVCSLVATPILVQKNGSTTLTASCTPAANTYSWTGGSCLGKTTSTCTATPAITTSYSVTGSNASGSSTANALVTVKNVDLTPILMLLLD